MATDRNVCELKKHTTSCPKCNNEKLRCLETRMRSDGIRRRRWGCLKCKFRWSVYVDDDKNEIPAPNKRLMSNSSARRLTEQDVKHVYATCGWKSNSILSDELGVSRQAINLILVGRTYRNLGEKYGFSYEERKARGNRDTCSWCVHFNRNECTLGFPEFKTTGLWAAAECNAFVRTDDFVL